jgi:hypothetical protein
MQTDGTRFRTYLDAEGIQAEHGRIEVFSIPMDVQIPRPFPGNIIEPCSSGLIGGVGWKGVRGIASKELGVKS